MLPKKLGLTFNRDSSTSEDHSGAALVLPIVGNYKQRKWMASNIMMIT
jgi:hypothetical protein